MSARPFPLASARVSEVELDRLLRLAQKKRHASEEGPTDQHMSARALQAIAYELAALRGILGELVVLQEHTLRVDRSARAELGDARSADLQDHALPTGPDSGGPRVDTYAGLKHLVRGLAGLDVDAVKAGKDYGYNWTPALTDLEELVRFARRWKESLEQRENASS